MFEDVNDKRRQRRFSLTLPVKVKHQQGEAVDAVTRDVSGRGIFIYMDADLSKDSQLEFTLTLPQEITNRKNVQVRCTGTVVRIVKEKSGQIGIAAKIDNYRFVSESESQAAAL